MLAASWSCQRRAAPAAAPACEVSGLVRDARSAAPIGNAGVAVSGRHGLVATTLGDGRFALRSDGEGPWAGQVQSFIQPVNDTGQP